MASALRALPLTPALSPHAGRGDDSGRRLPPLLPNGEKVAEGRMRGAEGHLADLTYGSGFAEAPLIASHSLGTSPRRGEEGVRLAVQHSGGNAHG